MITYPVRELLGPDLTPSFLGLLGQLSVAEPLPAATLGEILRERLSKGIRTYLVDGDDGPVATASLLIERKFTHGGGRLGHIEDVVVRHDLRHGGLGSMIVGHLIGVAREAGCYRVILNCHETVKPFYNQLGFVRSSVGMRLDLI